MKFTFLVFFFCLSLFPNSSWSQNIKYTHKPAWQTPQEKLMRKSSNEVLLSKNNLLKKIPDNIVLPGEFEESKAVIISWSYDYDVNGPTTVDVNSEYGNVSAQLAEAIQKECAVWIRIKAASDSNTIINHMNNRGTPLTNYRFFVMPLDDWWTRDFGPMAFYNNNLDSIGFVDMKYYDGRDNDNVFPQLLSEATGIPNYISSIYAEGGNLMTDGFGQLHFSNVISLVNSDETIHNGGWTSVQTLDTLKHIFNTPQLVELKTLECDGGTGHIDLYTKFIDEQTLIVAKYPDTITAQDKQIIEDNVQRLFELKSTYNRPFRIIRVEHPTNDAGKHSRRSCTQIDADARNFINGVTVNKSFIFPSYTDGITGNRIQHQRIIEFYKRIMPGYNIVPIDSRDLSPLGGAIHCITMQVPADNPIRFWHPSVDEIQSNLNKYHIVAKIQTPSGIANAKCFYRKNGGNWIQETLTDSNGYYIGDIVNSGLQGLDSIEYYLEATSVNGKTQTKPITASNGGYYTIRLAYASGQNTLVQPKNHLFNAYPNPASTNVVLSFRLNQKADASLVIFDINGKEVLRKTYTELTEGLVQETLDIIHLPQGVYAYYLLVNGNVQMGKKFIKQ